jgi:hypothetical protein
VTPESVVRPTIASAGGRRLISFLVIAAVIGVPAGVLRLLCVGNSCARQVSESAAVPFCSLPGVVRELIQDGFYAQRSPDVLIIAGATPIVGGTAFHGARAQPVWPSSQMPIPTKVPILFWGHGVRDDAGVPAGSGLDDIAPTLATIMSLHRPHPEVRSGRPIEQLAIRSHPRLVLQFVWKGVSSRDTRANMSTLPTLKRLMNEGSGTLTGTVPSLPLDPASAVTTVGTGGTPSQHGITGTLVRNDRGRLTRAWAPRSPVNVIATLADDLDERRGQRPVVGLVGTDLSDRGAIGGRWYWPRDRDHIAVVDRSRTTVRDEVRRMLRAAQFGRDRVTDLMAVVVEGTLPALDRQLAAVTERARRAARGSLTVALAGTGPFQSPSSLGDPDVLPADRIERIVEQRIPSARSAVEGSSPGGLFLDQDALSDLEISDDAAVTALRNSMLDGEKVVADAFPSRAVSFARFC